jgi:hypothetical protein
MAYLVIEDFRLGQDNRRPVYASPSGSLTSLLNGHITKGGEPEKRKALVSTYALPAGETLGLASVDSKIFVFGSGGTQAAGTIQMTSAGTGVAPNDTTRLWLYVDGVALTETYRVITAGSSISGIVDGLAASINAYVTIPNYTAVSDGVDTITITAEQPGTGSNGLAITTANDPSEPNPDPTGPAFVIVDLAGGVDGPTMPDGVNYQYIVHPDADQDLVRVIDVEPFDGKLYVIAEFADSTIWHYYDGRRVTAIVDNRSRGSFEVGAGTEDVSTITSVTVDGVEIMGQTVTYAATAAATAAAIAAAINAYVSVPDYTASAIDDVVFILADSAAGATPNGYVVAVTDVGVTIGTPVDMAGGAALASGTFAPGLSARTVDSKMYTTAGPILQFSGVDDPTVHDAASVTYPGAGRINISNHAAGSEQLTTVETFYEFLAIFARDAIQLWSVFADDDLNKKAQAIKNTGTFAAASVVPLGDNDVAYLTESGVRSLHPRDRNNYALVNELGAPIDSAVTTQIAAQTALVKSQALAFVEPLEKRLWVVIGDKVYVHSRYSSGQSISAWSVYDFGVSITAATVIGTRLYLRAGDTIYTYGGTDGTTYGSDYLVTVQLPFVDGRKIATFKEFTALDLGCEGVWTLQAAFDPRAPNSYQTLAVITGPTYNEAASLMPGAEHTHVSIKLTHQAAGYARISNLVLHYDVNDAS